MHRKWAALLAILLLFLIFLSGCVNTSESNVKITDQSKDPNPSLGSNSQHEVSIADLEKKLKEGDYDAAIEALNTSIQNDPDNADLKNYKGLFFLYKGADIHKQASLSDSPDFTRINEAYMLYHQAGLIFDEIISKHPDNVEAFNNKGVVEHLKMQNLHNAINWFDKALALNASYTPSMVNKAFTMLGIEGYDGLNKNETKKEMLNSYFEKTLKSDPSCYQIYIGKSFLPTDFTEGYLEKAYELYPHYDEEKRLDEVIFGNYYFEKLSNGENGQPRLFFGRITTFKPDGTIQSTLL